MPSKHTGDMKCMTCPLDAIAQMPGHLTFEVPLFVARCTLGVCRGSVCTVVTVRCLCLAVACQQPWQHVWSCAHTCQRPTEPFAHCQAPACDDRNNRSSELSKEGTCDHAAGPAPPCRPQLCRLLHHQEFVITQHQWCLRRNAMCHLQLLCKQLLMLCIALPHYLNCSIMACLHQHSSEQVCTWHACIDRAVKRFAL